MLVPSQGWELLPLFHSNISQPPVTRQQCFQEPFRVSKSSCTEGSSLWKWTRGKELAKGQQRSQARGAKAHIHMLFVHALCLPSLLGKWSVERQAQMSYSRWILLLSSLPSWPRPYKGLPVWAPAQPSLRALPTSSVLYVLPTTRQDTLAGLGIFYTLSSPAGCLRHSTLSESASRLSIRERKKGRVKIEGWGSQTGQSAKQGWRLASEIRFSADPLSICDLCSDPWDRPVQPLSWSPRNCGQRPEGVGRTFMISPGVTSHLCWCF